MIVVYICVIGGGLWYARAFWRALPSNRYFVN